jgi:N-acetylglucosaminyldiphosphoundecaprenol N-acetyl-beta-D-mannosaminyltransferase
MSPSERDANQVSEMAHSKEDYFRARLVEELARDFSVQGIRRRRRSRFWSSRSRLYARRSSNALWRLLEIAVAASLLVAFAPVLLILFAWAKTAGGKIGHRVVLGRQAVPFPLFQFEFPSLQTASEESRKAVAGHVSESRTTPPTGGALESGSRTTPPTGGALHSESRTTPPTGCALHAPPEGSANSLFCLATRVRAFRAPWWADTCVAKIPALCNVLRGEMSFIGPRPVSPNEFPISERNAWKRYDLRPGFISVWWLRQRGNIDYARETDLDAEYVETRTFRGDLGIALRALPALTYGKSSSEASDQVSILGIPISNFSLEEAANQIVRLAESGGRHQVCFINADCVNVAFRDPHYRAVLLRSDLVFADGIGMRLAGQLLRRPIRQNVNGTDLLPALCSAAAAHSLGIYLLGGRPGVAEAAAEWMRKQQPALRICGGRHGFFELQEEPALIEAIRQSGADILLVALGAPKQEFWIDRHKAALPGVSIGVGGLFDFYSGSIPRAPVWMREIGMEWFFRFLQEPNRMWRRYFLGNLVFLLRVLGQRIRNA